MQPPQIPSVRICASSNERAVSKSMISDGASNSGRHRCRFAAAIAVLALAVSTGRPAFAQFADESAASAAWKTAALASGPASPVDSSDLKASPAAATTENLVDTPPPHRANPHLTPLY